MQVPYLTLLNTKRPKGYNIAQTLKSKCQVCVQITYNVLSGYAHGCTISRLRNVVRKSS